MRSDRYLKHIDFLRILGLLSSGLSVEEVAHIENMSTAKIYAIRAEIKHFAHYEGGLEWGVVEQIVSPRRRIIRRGKIKESRENFYSGPAISVERAINLQDWYNSARDVFEAQSEYEVIGLSDLEDILRNGPKMPFEPTVAFRRNAATKSWDIFRMNGWGDWCDDTGRIVARGGLSAIGSGLGNGLNDSENAFFGCSSSNDPDFYDNKLIFGFPIVINDTIIHTATTENDAIGFCLEFCGDSDRLHRLVIDYKNFGKIRNEYKLKFKNDAHLADEGWRELVHVIGSWVAGPAWIDIFSKLIK